MFVYELLTFEKVESGFMSKRISAKYKIDRRLKCNLWGRPKSPYNKRESGPGQHGAGRRRKQTDYGLQLSAKQRLKGYYGNISEKRFRRYYKSAMNSKGDSAENLVGQLEHRLDAVVYRAKFVPTVFAARQFISHGHVLVNGKRVNIASYSLKLGDVVSVRDGSRDFPMVLEAMNLAEREVPEYVSVDDRKMSATLVRTPKLDDIPYPALMEPNMVIEFYSR